MISEDIAHNCGPECTGATCPEYPLDFAMFYAVTPLTAKESADAKRERYAAAERASRAYYDELNRSGSMVYAKLAARYAANNCALECTSYSERAPSFFWTIGKDAGVTCGGGFTPKRRGLSHGRCLENRRPGAEHGWSFSWPNEDEQSEGVYVRTRIIDGCDYAVFRVGPGHYMAQSVEMALQPIPATGFVVAHFEDLCVQDGQTPEQQLVLVWVAADRCK